MNERIPILFDRALRPEWIDFALEKRFQVNDYEAFRLAVRDHLAPEVNGAEALRKTVSQLQRTVGFRTPIPEARLRESLHQMQRLSPDARTPVRMALLMQSQPFFTDCVSAMRKLQALGIEGVTYKQMYERIAGKYGERGTVPRSVERVLQTLAFLGVARNEDRCWYLQDAAVVADQPG